MLKSMYVDELFDERSLPSYILHDAKAFRHEAEYPRVSSPTKTWLKKSTSYCQTGRHNSKKASMIAVAEVCLSLT